MHLPLRDDDGPDLFPILVGSGGTIAVTSSSGAPVTAINNNIIVLY